MSNVSKLPQTNQNFRAMLLAGAKNREKLGSTTGKGTLNKDDKAQLKKRGLLDKKGKKPGLFQKKVADTDADGN